MAGLASAAVDRLAVLTMPFPLAHPAVVLPLWRIRWLSLSALMLGCLTPDVSYALPGGGWTGLAHSLPGTIWFCLPVGLLAYVLFRTIREPLATRLPAPHREVLMPLCRGREHSWFAIAISVWIGACSHVLLDALTRESQMLVPHLVGLRNEIAAIEREGIRFSRLLWFALSGAGLVALVMTYAWLIRKRTGRWSWFDRKEWARYAAWIAFVLVPLLVITFGTANPVRHWPWRYRFQHFVHDTMAMYLVVLSGLILILGILLRLRQFVLHRPAPPE
jgi:hypothetical protein